MWNELPGLAIGMIILMVITLLLLVALAWWVRLRLRKQEQQHQVLINVLRNEIQGFTGSSIGMGKRLLEIEEKLNLTAEKQVELENRDPGVLAYNQAARLMEMGAGVEDLIKTCGIGRPEAELMALLHRELQTQDKISHKP